MSTRIFNGVWNAYLKFNGFKIFEFLTDFQILNFKKTLNLPETALYRHKTSINPQTFINTFPLRYSNANSTAEMNNILLCRRSWLYKNLFKLPQQKVRNSKQQLKAVNILHVFILILLLFNVCREWMKYDS